MSNSCFVTIRVCIYFSIMFPGVTGGRHIDLWGNVLENVHIHSQQCIFI